MEKNKKVLLTGVTGFLGSHTTIQLLNRGYEVTGTLRNAEREEQIRGVIARHTSKADSLQLAEADLMDEQVWDELMSGIDYVQHVASPFPRELPNHEDELIIPAKNGTLNVLKAAARHNVKRVVLTSSSGAIIYGKEKDNRSGTYTESDWTNIQNKTDTTPYFRSKTIAEKAAWEYMGQDDSNMELTTVCPGAILGPILEKDFGTSANIVIKLLDGSSPALLDLGFDIVDVRSVADLLIRAMEHPQAANERFIGSAGYLKFEEIADILRKEYTDMSIPSKTLPDFMVRLFSWLDKSLRPILIDLGVKRKVDNSKAQKILHWKPLPNHKAILSCANSVVNFGLIT